MSMQDPIAEMLTIIRNGLSANKKIVVLSFSKIKVEIIKLLVNQGYLQSFEVLNKLINKKSILINLKYYKKKPVIELLKRISKPSLRIYKSYKDIPTVRNGLGCSIISTSQGLMIDKDARKKHCGGEVICYVA